MESQKSRNLLRGSVNKSIFYSAEELPFYKQYLKEIKMEKSLEFYDQR